MQAKEKYPRVVLNVASSIARCAHVFDTQPKLVVLAWGSYYRLIIYALPKKEICYLLCTEAAGCTRYLNK